MLERGDGGIYTFYMYREMVLRDGLDVSRENAFLPGRSFESLSLWDVLKGLQKTLNSTAGQETWKGRHKKLRSVLDDRGIVSKNETRRNWREGDL